ncbi:Uncharacterized membrane protein [Jatrophihabitans endophyticus]|uniref:Uncharacterized membrane protein n=1 Tax=Jatrophihabitans endophyticus TaxID=1206085 RepID=A0A1M5RMD2_9ACTN|nr:DUF1003 domain-containing protein [Jatrophihabitans endophyticus]SHH27484.1 Uncharacterized membrane protein [Jatrophihabitans endophyticus]
MAERRGRPERARLDQPRAERRGPRVRFDAEAFGKLTEAIARFLGTGRYLVVQTVIIGVWLIVNLVPGIPHFDAYPLGFLTLVLSLQASYAAPLILLAQNRQDDRDRVNLDADREEARESKADLEYLAREIAAIRMALGEVATRDFVRSELQRIEDRVDDIKAPKKERKKRDAGGETVETVEPVETVDAAETADTASAEQA